MQAKPHPKQARRLAALRRYDILDTPRERDFDDVVDLASEICGTPIAVVNLIDESRQWFKAEVGLGVRETPLKTSICSHIILEHDFVEITDTLNDPRTADNELCLAPDGGLRFYAGALLKAENGLPIGTLCVLDTKPNELSDLQKRTLKILAQRVMRELDLRLMLKSHDDLRAEMDHRVKNSLQTISSSLRLHQRRGRKLGEWDDAFAAVGRQIDAVSALHRELHRSDSIGTLDLSEYINTLARHLHASVPTEIILNVNVIAVQVEPSLATSFGTVINEFVANAIKHGFGEGHIGTINIDVRLTPNWLELNCHNDGGGVKSKSQEPTTGLGKRLVNAAITRHGGTVAMGPADDNGYYLKAMMPFTGSDE